MYRMLLLKQLVFKKGGVLIKIEKWFYNGSVLDIYVCRIVILGHSCVANELWIKSKRVFTSILSSLAYQ